MRSVVANYRRTRLSSNNMATVEQSIIAFNLQLSEANTQIGMMSLALDTLRNESIAASGSRLAAPVCRGASCREKTNEVHFINTRVFGGSKYTGSRKESFKTWSKNVKIFFNSQHGGMRQALETSEDASAKGRFATSSSRAGSFRWRQTTSYTTSA